MRFLADENLYQPLIDYILEEGHSVLNLRNMGLAGITDEEVYQIACEQNLIILTMDKDFTRTFRFAPQNCGGIIVVKIYKRTINETLSIFKKFFSKLTQNDITNNLVIITPEGIKIRRTR